MRVHAGEIAGAEPAVGGKSSSASLRRCRHSLKKANIRAHAARRLRLQATGFLRRRRRAIRCLGSPGRWCRSGFRGCHWAGCRRRIAIRSCPRPAIPCRSAAGPRRLLIKRAAPSSLTGRRRAWRQGRHGRHVLPALSAAFEALLPSGKVLQAWGMTELQFGACSRPNDSREIRLNTIGRATPGTELRVADREGNLLPEGEVGELHVRGCSLFSGYVGNDEATRSTFCRRRLSSHWRTSPAWTPMAMSSLTAARMS